MFTTEFLDLAPLETAGGVVVLPGSKSISNRVLLLAGLGAGTTAIHDLLDSDDTRVMLAALEQLGCRLDWQAGVLHLTGLGAKPPASPARLFLGNAGTAMRPLTAALSVLGGDFELSGVARMHERPIGDLVDALRELGCSVDTRPFASARRACAWTAPSPCAATCPASSSRPCSWPCRWWPHATS
jgi:3-phosphoshikimate 1-carboxyvinyltransferase